VRGDSVRDFYAKGLALLGLSLIAGVGALVDHWPTGGAMQVPASLAHPQVAGALGVPRLSIRTPDVASPMLPVASPSTPARRTSTVARRVETPPQPLPASVPVMSVAMAVPWSLNDVTLTAPPSRFDVTPAPAVSAPATLLALSEPSLPDGGLRLVAASDNGSDDGDGFITGAFKKTGLSIIRGGAKTGASIADAARALGGAFKHVWIFQP